MKLTFTKLKTKLQIDATNGTGLSIARVSSKFADDGDFATAAQKLGVDAITLRAALIHFEAGGPAEIDLARDFVVWMRGLRSTSDTSIPFAADGPLTALTMALESKDLDVDEPVLSWSGTNQLAALDLDAVEGYTFDDQKLLQLEGIPVPSYSWPTRSGGLRLIYIDQEPFAADEIAAVAYLSLMQTTPYRSLEIKHETRHPAYPSADGRACGTVLRRQQQFDPGHLRRWLKMYSASDVEATAWLDSRGLKIGGRYEHNHCPACPDYVSHGTPVLVGDKGITCFSCEARGVTEGSTKPGFFPYSSLCGQTASSTVYRCMENAVHWEHARFILRSKLGITGHYAQLVYSAGLLLHGWPRPVVNKCINSCQNVIRMGDRWTNLNGETYNKDIKPLIATLPGCLQFHGPKPIVDRARVVAFDQTHDLSRYGYPSLYPIYGMPIWSHHMEERQPSAVIQTRELSDEARSKLRPRYVKGDEVKAWRTIEKVFPNINREFVKLLIAARGVVEGDMSMTPMIFATGPTGGGKSLSVFLAASICGDKNTEVVWSADTAKLRQAIIDSHGTFVTFNEVLKEAQRQSRNGIQSMDFILNLTPESVSHYMYAGPVRMGRLPVLVWTDTDLPAEVKTDAQIARRLVHVQISQAMDWEDSLKRSGIGHPSSFRTSSEEHAEACNIILSSVIDDHFREPWTIEEIASRLGFFRISRSEEAEDGRTVLKYFFKAVCNAPKIEGDDALRFAGRGWKIIRKDLETELRTLWTQLCDSPETFNSSRRCAEQDWCRLMQLKEPALFECRAASATKVAVRFRSVSGNRQSHKYNEELL